MKNNIDYIFREVQNPDPIEKVNTKLNIVEYGKDNLHPQFLYNLINYSPIHGGIIQQKINFIVGEKLEVKGWGEEVLNNFGATKTYNDLIESFVTDTETLNYFFILYKKNAQGNWIAKELSAELVRPNEDLTLFHYSEDWSYKNQSEDLTGYKVYKSIHTIDREEDDECVLFCQAPSKQFKIDLDKKRGKDNLSKSIYPMPTYSGGIVGILSDIEMNWFHYAESVNGWTSNTIVNLNNGVPEDDTTKKRIIRDLKDGATDKSKKGGITVLFNDGKEREATISNIGGNGNDTKYIITQEHVTQSIMIAHSVQNPALFGLEIAGKLGGASEVPFAYARFKDTYIKKKQRFVSERLSWGVKFLNDLSDDGSLDFIDHTPQWVKDLQPQPERQFKSEKKEVSTQEVISQFAKVGRPKDSVNIIHSREFNFTDNDEDYKQEFLSSAYKFDLNADQARILQMIDKGESYNAIKNALGKESIWLSRQLLDLQKQGLVDGWKLTTQGQNASATTEQIEVVYSYEVRPEFGPDEVIDGTRDFCRELIKLNRVFTRSEINQIPTDDNRSVWLYRGGWYHNPDTQKNQPSCRHYWVQRIISK